jgi:hypothetical protein
MKDKHAKTIEPKRKLGICFRCKPKINDQKLRKSRRILEKFEITVSFRQIAVDFCSIGG